jgi:tetratricopeptide (TPR) repeat protein
MTRDEMSAAHAFRGLARAGLGLHEAALADFDAAIAADNGNALGFFGRGWVYAEIGEAEKAIPDLERSLELDLDPDIQQDVEAVLQKLKP